MHSICKPSCSWRLAFPCFHFILHQDSVASFFGTFGATHHPTYIFEEGCGGKSKRDVTPCEHTFSWMGKLQQRRTTTYSWNVQMSLIHQHWDQPIVALVSVEAPPISQFPSRTYLHTWMQHIILSSLIRTASPPPAYLDALQSLREMKTKSMAARVERTPWISLWHGNAYTWISCLFRV